VNFAMLCVLILTFSIMWTIKQGTFLILSVVIPTVIIRSDIYTKCHYAECRYAESGGTVGTFCEEDEVHRVETSIPTLSI
jgi:hypothetical protein